MKRYFFYIAAVAAILTAACSEDPPEKEEPVISEEPLIPEEPVVPVTGITHNIPATLELLVGATLTLTAAVEPAEATDKIVTWNTSDDRVATVNSAGELTAVASGTVTITATTDDGEFTATCTVTVTEEITPETGIITMTTQASEVSFWIHIELGTDNLVIDWGDGEKSNLGNALWHDPYYYYHLDEYMFFHSYSGASEHRITIAGDNMVSLNCNWNQLIELDVSRNTALKELYCYNNLLTTLDANTTLTDLTCSNNQLTSLDVNKCTMLIYLNCGNNQLTALDVSNNTQLTHLYCPNNQLTALALNYMFRTLRVSPNSQLKYNPYPNPWFWLNIDANPGTSDCDVSIAREKGWWVYPHIYLIE